MGNRITKQIRQARDKEELDLARWQPGLKVVPPHIKGCKRLLRLILTDNQLADLPIELGLLDSLESLDFSKNNFNHFPTSLPKSIKEVKASHNRLFYSPITPKIGELQSLQKLDLSYNQLEELPKELGCLKLLHLNLEHNDLKVGTTIASIAL
jgi:Leucine-rich repeat (LRR) protein